MYATKPKPVLRGHNPDCIGLPGDPCGKTINMRIDYAHELDSRGVMHYRCRDCHERAEIRKAIMSLGHEHKRLDE